MKNSITFLLLLMSSFLSINIYAQVIEISVVDSYSKPILGYEVFIDGILKESNLNQKTSTFNVTLNEKVEIKHPYFEIFSFALPNTISRDDTLKKIITLSPKFQEFDEFSVIGSKFKEVFDEKNEFVIDYYLYPKESQVLLTKLKNGTHLKLIREGATIDSLAMNFKAESLFLDALGNFFLFGEKDIHQFNIVNDKFIFTQSDEIDLFNKTIKDAVSLKANCAVYEKFSMLNQLYSLVKIENGEGKVIYDYLEKENYERASHFYNKTVNYYMTIIPEKDNVILMGLWDGDLMTLNGHPNNELEQLGINTNEKIMAMTSWSDKITSKPINVQSFGLMNQLLVLNGENDSIIHINYENLNVIKAIPSKAHLTGDYFFDYFYDQIYMITDTKGIKQVYKLNVNTGESSLIADLSEIHQPRNIKVINDQVYFLVLDKNGFNRLVKVN